MEIVINTYGTSVNRDNEGFVISTPDGRQRVPVDGVTIMVPFICTAKIAI